MRNTTRKGFTLIELLIVVVIIGILAAIAIPKFANTKEKAYLASMKSDLRNMATVQEGYFSDFQVYTNGTASNQGGTTASLSGFVPSAGVRVVAATHGWHGLERDGCAQRHDPHLRDLHWCGGGDAGDRRSRAEV